MTFLDEAATYGPTVFSLGAMGGLHLLQLLVVDVAGIRVRHPAGTPVEPDPTDFHFRAVRAHANTNESIAAFAMLALFAMLVRADPGWTNGACSIFVAMRIGHMICYWAGWATARSACFGVATLALIALFVTGMIGAFT